MDDVIRTQMLAHLNDLRDALQARAGKPEPGDAALVAHVAELQAMLEREPSDPADAHGTAKTFRARLLALEAEHPRLTAVASRIAQILETAGL